MSRTKHRNRNAINNDELRPVKSYKRMQKHTLNREYGLV